MTWTLTPAFIGLLGVIFGVLLRPIAEDLFKRRRDSLYIEFEESITAITSNDPQGLQLKINDSDVDRIFARDFIIRNRTGRTGRTQRNFTLNLTFEFKQGVADKRQWITLYRSQDAEFSVTKENNDIFRCDFGRLDRRGKISGRVVATYLGNLRAFTDSELEVFIGDRGKLTNPRKFFTTFLPIFILLAFWSIVWLVRFLTNG